MRAVKIVSLQLAMLFAIALPAHALDVEVSSFKLANGMEVVVIPDHRAPVVTHMVWYRVGAADEVTGKSGLAHFLEHLMFKGTPKHPAGEMDHLIDINGGEGNAFTTNDYTAYFQRIAALSKYPKTSLHLSNCPSVCTCRCPSRSRRLDWSHRLMRPKCRSSSQLRQHC